MARRTTKKRTSAAKSKNGRPEALEPRAAKKKNGEDSEIHIIRPGVVCETEPRGHATPRGSSPLELVVDATEGFVPLWARNTTLRWRFRESSMTYFKKPAAAKAEIRKLIGESLLAWGSAVPVKFVENKDVWDFEIVMRKSDDCDANGCTLAMAFFPDTGRHRIVIYPQMFAYPRQEQIETLCHELGHVFGLRHFFAQISENEWPSEIFGKHSKFSIMNYGEDSKLTSNDREDLRRLYAAAWSGKLTHINGTPIRFVKPFHSLAAASDSMVAVGPIQPEVQPALQPVAAFVG